MRIFARGAFSAVLLSVVLCALPARVSAGERRPGMDAATEEQLRRLDSAIDALQAPGDDYYPEQRASRGDRLNQAFVALTGEAINPLFGVTALGMYRYFSTPDSLKDSLPLYDRPEVWFPLLCIILLMLFNSTICEAMPFLKIPLNALGDIVNKAGAVAVLPLVVKMFADQLAVIAAPQFAGAGSYLFPAAFAGEPVAGLGFVTSQLGWIAGAVVGFVIYGAVWLSFNMIDVLILICPFPGVDAALKSFRLAVIGALAGMNQLSPTVAVFIAAVVAGMSLMLAGWSFRLSVFGFVFSTDILFFRKHGVGADGGCGGFSCGGMVGGQHGIPMRTWGVLTKNDGGELVFSYRPWLVLGRREVVIGQAADFSAGRGLLNPFLLGAEGGKWVRLPPRYRGEEAALAEALGLRDVVPCGAGGAFRAWLGELFVGGRTA